MKKLLLLSSVLLALGALAAPIKIMPLGDSITYGQGWDPHGGYRAVLREKLVNAGYEVDYVGTQTGNPGTLAASGDVQHEGHLGWTVSQISDALPGWFAQIEGPNVILLKIGTNNCNSDHTSVMNQICELLGKIKRLQPSAHVIVGTLVPFLNGTEDGSNNVWIKDHNALLKTEIATRAAAGDKVSLADLHAVVSPQTGMNDERHPNEEGYRAMANVWYDAIAALYPDPATAGGEVELTAVNCEMDGTTADRFKVSFNDPVDDDAANLAHYAFNDAFVAASATLADDRRSVTVVGSKPVKAGVTCTVTVSGVKNASGTKTLAATSFDFRYLPYGARHYVAEAGLYRKVYAHTFTKQKYGAQAPVYDFDDHLNVGPYTLIAYYIELQKEGGEMQYMWISMDKFTDDPGRIAIPTKFALTGEKEIFQRLVSNLKVQSNVAGVVNGDKARGNIEFWPYNYYGAAKLGLDGATNNYDFDDSCNLSGNFACMQIHDTDAKMPLFCYNNWGGSSAGSYDLGLGARPNSGNTDWTQSNSGETWNKRKIMEIYVLEDASDATVPQVVSTTLGENRTTVTVTFDRPVLDEPDLLRKVSLSNGKAVTGVTLADAKTLVVSCEALRAVSDVSLVLDGFRATNPAHTAIPRQTLALPGEDLPFPYASAPANVLEKVPAAADYAHVFTIDIQPTMKINIKDGASYANKVDPDEYAKFHTVDNRATAPEKFSRVGYLLELVDKNNVTNWIWTAYDSFSHDYGDIDVPTADPSHPDGGYRNARYVLNLDVDSNVAGIVTGTGLATGYIEFSPWDYGGGNKNGVPNATGNCDFGDELYKKIGSYACMQVHNYAAELADGSKGQVLWSFGRFNSSNVCVGIGNYTGSEHIDYTYVSNAGSYSKRTLYVLVLPGDDREDHESTTDVPSRAVASADGTKVCVTFDAAVAATAAQTRYYAIGGTHFTSAELSAADARDVILTVAEPLVAGETYTVTTQLPKSTNKSLALLTGRDLPQALKDGVAELDDYVLVYDLDIGDSVNYAKSGAPYRMDETRFGLGFGYDRVAYSLELDDTAKGGSYRWAWVSMEPFTDDPAKLGVPSITRENHFQCYVTDIHVRAGSSTGAAPIATGEWDDGNIEFTPSNYASENEKNIPGATGDFDWGDRLYGSGTEAGHGCMQIHNYREKDMILGVTRLNGGNEPGISIGLFRNADGSVAGDGTWNQNAKQFTTKNLRVFVRPVTPPAPEPITGDKGLGPSFLVQPASQKVKLVPSEGPKAVALNAYAPNAVRYQWRKNGVDIDGATGPVLTFAVSEKGVDSYSVIAFLDDDNYTISQVAKVEGMPMAFIMVVH